MSKELQSLKRENQELKRALNASISGILVVDKTHVITFVNEKWADIFGLDTEELLGKPIEESLSSPSQYKSKIKIALHDAEVNGEFIGELEFIDKEKDTKYLWVQIKSTKNDQGKLENFVITGNDLTKQKAQEKALLDRAEDLERLNKIMVNREVKMSQIKEENSKLKKKIHKIKDKHPSLDL